MSDEQPAPPGTVKRGDGKWILLAALIYIVFMVSAFAYGWSQGKAGKSIIPGMSRRNLPF